MPQLDIDLFDDFLFFAFVSLLFNVGSDESEESLIELQGEAAFTINYITKKVDYLVEIAYIQQTTTADNKYIQKSI